MGKAYLEDIFEGFDDIFAPRSRRLSKEETVGTLENDSVKLELDAPGIKREDIEIKAKFAEILSVKWTRKNKTHSHQWKLAKCHDVDKISSTLIDGVLTILVPLIPKSKDPDEIQIKVL